MFGFCLNQRRRIDGEYMILNGLSKDERESVAIAISRGGRPAALVALLEQPGLDVLARDPFRR